MIKNLKRICAALVCLSICLSSSVYAAVAADENSGALRYDSYDDTPVYAGYTPDYSGYNSFYYQLFMNIFNLYKDTHLYEFSEEELTEAFIMKLFYDHPEYLTMFTATLVETMDPYSGYYEVGEGLASDGYTYGYGISIGDETSIIARKKGLSKPGIYIETVLYNSKALEAGIQPGDRIVRVEGLDVTGLTTSAVMYYIRNLPFVEDEIFDENGVSLGIPNEPEFILNSETGKKEYPLHMTLERGGTEFDVVLTKGKMLASNITYDEKEKEYAYIGISSFMGDTLVQDFRSALNVAKKSKLENLIIDLRDNGGGVLEYAVEMANMLIEEKDRILYYENSRELSKPKPVYSTGGGTTFEKITLIVNENTVSAAELFASMLRYNCNTTLVGKTTYGKGVGQKSYAMLNGDIFTITSFEVLNALKQSYNNIGIVPDVEIKDCIEKFTFPTDLEEFSGEIFKKMPYGVQDSSVLGFERRLEMLGFMRSEYVDGIFDIATTSAINAINIYLDSPPTGTLNDEGISYITNVTEKLKNEYYYFDSQLEVAEMSFKSRSQATRRAKELERESLIAEKEKQQYDNWVLEQMREEIKAEKEAIEKDAEATSKEAPEIQQ